jgi:hypothetical protein
MSNLPEIIQKKSVAFAKYAEESHNKLQDLQTMAARTIANLSDLPTEIEQISVSEQILKAAKKESNDIKSERLAQTSKLDKFFENFMAPEKSVLAAIPAYEQAIIKLKNDKAIIDSAAINKANELRRVRETFLSHINNEKARFENEITDYVAKAFNYALNNAESPTSIKTKEGPEITMEDYIFKCHGTKKAENFKILIPSQYESFLEIWQEVSAGNAYIDGKLMLGKFEGDIKDKFKYFSVALKDVEKAKAHNEQQAIEAKELALRQAEHNNIGAKLATSATVLSDEPGVKALKEKFDIDMPSSQQSAMLIMAAFASNIDRTAGKVKADWMKLTINQMGAALAAIKNEDNKFEVSGINFKVIQKL